MRRLRTNACLLGKRLESTRNEAVDLQKQGMTLALMNIALAKLVVDLLAQSLKTSALPLFWA